MSVSCRVVGRGFELRVVDSGLWRARSGDGFLEVSVGLLKADAQASVAGERIAGPLLLPFRLEGCPAGLSETVRAVASVYRSRVVVEQLYDLSVRMGPLASEACIDPIYIPASRARLITHMPCYEPSQDEVEELRREYGGLASRVSEPCGGGRIRPRLPTLRGEFRAAALRVRSALLRYNAAIPLPKPPWGGCRAPLLVEGDLWSLIELPEGRFIGSCGEGPVGGLVKGECRPSPRFSSTYICDSGGGRVVVKDYIRMAVKWLPAAVLSGAVIRYRLGPRSRLAAEYRYLRLLRDVVPTPRFLLVCSDIARAAAVREYVEGDPVLDSRDPGRWRLAGRVIGLVHSSGYILGDSNPGNIVVDPAGRPWLIDAEQARPYSDKGAAWDIVVALVYASTFGARREQLEALLEGYSESWEGARRILELASAPVYWLSLGALPQALRAGRVLRSYIGKAGQV